MNDSEFALIYAVQRDSDMQEEALCPESELSGLMQRRFKEEIDIDTWEDY